jgi:hypothetical protein
MALLLLSLIMAACSSTPEPASSPETTATPAASPVGTPGTPSPTTAPEIGELESNCFDWPSREFSRTHVAELEVAFSPGETAPDFTLQDTNGRAHSLYELLETKPVLIVFGAFT